MRSVVCAATPNGSARTNKAAAAARYRALMELPSWPSRGGSPSRPDGHTLRRATVGWNIDRNSSARIGVQDRASAARLRETTREHRAMPNEIHVGLPAKFKRLAWSKLAAQSGGADRPCSHADRRGAGA